MKKLQSILCVSFLTLAISSVTLAGNISGAPAPDNGNISGRNGNISGAPAPDNGNISGRDGNISGRNGNISGISVGDILGIIIWDVLLG